MNENFNAALSRKGISLYHLAQTAGVPYTTISEIKNGKKNINTKAAETVYRLSAALEVPAAALLNPVFIMNGVHGIYRGVSYKWILHQTMLLSLKLHEKENVIHTEYTFTNPDEKQTYMAVTEMLIDQWLREIEFEEAFSAALKTK